MQSCFTSLHAAICDNRRTVFTCRFAISSQIFTQKKKQQQPRHFQYLLKFTIQKSISEDLLQSDGIQKYV